MSLVSLSGDEENETPIFSSGEEEDDKDDNSPSSYQIKKLLRRPVGRRGVVQENNEDKKERLRVPSKLLKRSTRKPVPEPTIPLLPKYQPHLHRAVETIERTLSTGPTTDAVTVAMRSVEQSEIKSIDVLPSSRCEARQSSCIEKKPESSIPESSSSPTTMMTTTTPPSEPEEDLVALAHLAIFQDELPGMTTLLDFGFVPEPVNELERALNNWSEFRRKVCRLGIQRQDFQWQQLNFDAMFKPFIDLAHSADFHVVALRDSPYCPVKARYGWEEVLEVQELSNEDAEDIVKCLTAMTRILRKVVEAPSYGGVERYLRLLELQENASARYAHMREKTERLRVALARNHIAAEIPVECEKVSGALRVSRDQSIGQDGSRPLFTAMRSTASSWLRMMRLRCELDPGPSSPPLKATLRYRWLQLQFSKVPISMPAPHSIIEDTGPVEAWVLEWRERKLTEAQCKIVLDGDDRANIAKAVAAYKRFHSGLSKRGHDDVALLRHKVTTRMKLYEARLEGVTHMLPMTIPIIVTANNDSSDLEESSKGANSLEASPADTCHGPLFNRPGGYLQVGENKSFQHVENVWQGGNGNGPQ